MAHTLSHVLPVALCGTLCVLGTALAQPKAGAAEAAPDAPDEVVVLGRINELRTEVQRSEEAFYDRFNEVNGDHKFDIHCRLEPLINSHIPRRVCASNAWHDIDAKIGAASLREIRGEPGNTPDSLVNEQTYTQKQLTDAMRRATARDPQLQQAMIANVAGEIRNLDLRCAQGERPIPYQDGVDWTVPHGWTGCTLLVAAAPATMFNFYEFE